MLVKKKVAVKRKTINIKFIPTSEDAQNFTEAPVPAKKSIPNWYKKIPNFNVKDLKLNTQNVVTNSNLKMCMPFFDALTGGYIQKTWTDIYINYTDEGIKYASAVFPQIISTRDIVSPKIDSNYYPIEFIWLNQWNTMLPKGYSMLITHPLNRLDLPFITLSAIIDMDNFYHTKIGSIPFFIYKNFTGVIPAGTPMFQMIPVKRKDWNSSVETYNELLIKKLQHKRSSKFYSAYKTFFWVKKNYN